MAKEIVLSKETITPGELIGDKTSIKVALVHMSSWSLADRRMGEDDIILKSSG